MRLILMSSLFHTHKQVHTNTQYTLLSFKDSPSSKKKVVIHIYTGMYTAVQHQFVSKTLQEPKRSVNPLLLFNSTLLAVAAFSTPPIINILSEGNQMFQSALDLLTGTGAASGRDVKL